MALDISALKSFHATLKPLLDAIPAVLDLVNVQNDLDRAIAAKRKEYETLLGDIEQERRLHAERVESAQSMVKQEQQRLADVKASVAAARVQGDSEVAAAKQQLAHEAERLAKQSAMLRSQIDGLAAEYETKSKQFDELHAQKVAVAQVELDAITTLHGEAASALALIRSKLG